MYVCVPANHRISFCTTTNVQGTAPYLISPLEGIQKMTGVTVTYAEGCDVLCASTDGFADATSAASKSDVAIVVIGITNSQER